MKLKILNITTLSGIAVFMAAFAPATTLAEIYIANPAVDKQCELVIGVKTTDSAVVNLVKQFGAKAKVIHAPANIKSNGQRVALLELPTKNGPSLFTVMDGDIEQCKNFVANTKESINKREKSDSPTAANWVRLGALPDGSRTDFVDRNSVRTDGSGLIRLWLKQEHPIPQAGPNAIRFSSTKVSLALNCKDYTTAPTSIGYYDNDGAVVLQAEKQRSEWNFTESPPDSLLFVLLRSHCKR